MPGVFAGYELGERGRWNKKYLVWNLWDFEGMSLAMSVDPSNVSVGEVNRVFTVRKSTPEWEFPLRAEYVRKNRTLDGVTEQVAEWDGTAGGHKASEAQADAELSEQRL